MNSLIKYGLYFVVAFSVLAFGAAEVWAFSVVGKKQKKKQKGQVFILDKQHDKGRGRGTSLSNSITRHGDREKSEDGGQKGKRQRTEDLGMIG